MEKTIRRCFFSRKLAELDGARIAKQPSGNHIFITHWWRKDCINNKSIELIKQLCRPDLEYVGDV